MDVQQHLEEAQEWRKSAILNRNYQVPLKGFFEPQDSYLDAAHRCELRAEYHEQFIFPSPELLRGYL